MAWTTPRTWVTAELVTASQLNVNMRDNSRVLYNSGPRMGGGQVGYSLDQFTGSGDFANVAVFANMTRLVIPDALEILDDGFTPQTRVAGRMKTTTTGVARARAAIHEIADGDALIALISSGTIPEAATANQNGADAFVWADTGWQDATVTPGTDPDWIIVLQVGTSTGTGTFQEMLMGFRWK